MIIQERKNDFNQKVNRETTNSKVLDLVSETEKLIKVCENEEKYVFIGLKEIFLIFF